MTKPMSGASVLDLPVDQLLCCWPRSARAFIALHMACVGCAFARFHTLRQALDIYGIEADSFLRQLAQVEPAPHCAEDPILKED